MTEKTIEITLTDVRNLVSLIDTKYSEAIRYNPRYFIRITKGEATSYYRLLEKYAEATRGGDK